MFLHGSLDDFGAVLVAAPVAVAAARLEVPDLAVGFEVAVALVVAVDADVWWAAPDVLDAEAATAPTPRLAAVIASPAVTVAMRVGRFMVTLLSRVPE